MKTRIPGLIAGIVFWWLFLGSVHALPLTGSLSKTDFEVGGCEVLNLVLFYKIERIDDIPVVSAAFEWQGTAETAVDCLDENTVLYLKLSGNNGGQGYIPLYLNVPLSGMGYGQNATRSYAWDGFLCGSGTRAETCLSAQEARELWESGVQVDGLAVEYGGEISDEAISQSPADTDADEPETQEPDNGDSEPSQAQPAVALEGAVSYAIQDNVVSFEVESIVNYQQTATDPMHLRLYATPEPYSGGPLQGHELAAYPLAQGLNPNGTRTDLRGTAAYTPPPAGTYYLTVVLTELSEGQDLIADYVAFTDPRSFEGTGETPQTDAGSGDDGDEGDSCFINILAE